jgi:hypothetical protein
LHIRNEVMMTSLLSSNDELAQRMRRGGLKHCAFRAARLSAKLVSSFPRPFLSASLAKFSQSERGRPEMLPWMVSGSASSPLSACWLDRSLRHFHWISALCRPKSARDWFHRRFSLSSQISWSVTSRHGDSSFESSGSANCREIERLWTRSHWRQIVILLQIFPWINAVHNAR